MGNRMKKMMKSLLSSAFFLHAVLLNPTSYAAVITIGNDPSIGSKIGWLDGVCYAPIDNVRVGDNLVFEFSKGFHDVHKLWNDRSYFDKCNFDNATLLSDDDGISTYTVEEKDEGKELYFACSVGSHCNGGMQRVRVNVISLSNDTSNNEELPISSVVLGSTPAECNEVQENGIAKEENDDGTTDSSSSYFDSTCSEASKQLDEDGREWLFKSCLSAPMTLTPGGIINQAAVVQYPYPTDRRVLIGTRIFEFVREDDDGGVLQPVNVNELYVHHILGDVVLGNGAESIRREDEDAAFEFPYGKVSGDGSDIMTFHIIDLRTVNSDYILPCVECRCGGIYSDSSRGSIRCCTNCTTSMTPTVDYRMRYNVTYKEILPEDNVKPIQYVTADITPAIRYNIEFDVPHYTMLPPEHRLENDPTVQVLQREDTLENLFFHGLLDNENTRSYDGPPVLRLHRCTGHMHIGAIFIRLEDVESGEIICDSVATYGTDPKSNDGFIESMSVTNFDDEPKYLRSDQTLRLTTHYNASDIHTGVMGLFQLWYSDEETILSSEETSLSVQFCHKDDEKKDSSSCDSLLGDIDDLQSLLCKDRLVTNDAYAFICTQFGVCDCDALLQQNLYPTDGCGGVITHPTFGTYDIDFFCAKTCGCKNVKNREKAMNKALRKELQKVVRHRCHYSTIECNNYLSQLYSCSKQLSTRNNNNSTNIIDDDDDTATIRNFIRLNGEYYAKTYSKLGHPTLHRNDKEEEEVVIPKCKDYNTPLIDSNDENDNNNEQEGDFTEDDNTNDNNNNESSSSATTTFRLPELLQLLCILLFGSYYY